MRANSLREDDRVGLREEDQRIVDDVVIGRFEIVVAQAAVAGHVDAENRAGCLRPRICESTIASMTGTATRTVEAA